MKYALSIIWIFYITTVSFSQETVVVYDAETNEIIVGAKVILHLSKKDSIIKITNSKGRVDFSLKKDSAFIHISFLGYKSYFEHIYKHQNLKIYLESKDVLLNPVVVTGQFQPSSKNNSIYDVTVVNNKNIEEKASTNMQEVLNNQLNFKTNNGHTNETALNINGLSGAHVKFMIDGVPVEGRVNGNIDLSQINTNDIQRVEIIEGPVSVVYGTNALGGIVNIITKKNINKTTAFVNTYYESIGKYNFNGGFALNKNKSSFKLSGGRNFFSGYTDNDTLRSKIWKPREQYFGNVLFGYQLKRLKFSTTINGFNEKMLSKGNLKPPYYTTAIDVHTSTNRLRNYYLLNGKLSSKIYLDLTLGYSYYKRKRNIYFKDLTTLDQFLTTGSNDQDTTIYHNFIFRGFYSHKILNDKLTYLVGTELKQDFIISNRIESKSKEIGNYAVFSSIKYQPIKNLTIQPALRYAYNTVYKAPVVPSIITEYKFKSFKLKAFYAKGFRTPSLKELFLEFHYNSTINLYGNQNLTSEHSNHFMIELSYQKNRFKILTKAFYNKIEDLIALVKTSNINWQYNNVGYYITKGATINLNYKYNPFKLMIGYTYLGTYNGQLSDSNFENKYNYNSNLISTLKYNLKKWKTGATLTYKYIGQTANFYTDENNQVMTSFIGAYSLMDISLFKKLYNNKITLVTGVKNLLNTTQVQLQGKVFGFSTPKNASSMSILWGRTYFISLRFKL